MELLSRAQEAGRAAARWAKNDRMPMTLVYLVASFFFMRLQQGQSDGVASMSMNPLGFLKQKPKVYRTSVYPGLAKGGGDLVIREVNHAMLEELCLQEPVCIKGEDCLGTMDNGTRISHATKERVWGCNWPGQIVHLYGKACIVPHELCHEAGLPASVCESAYHANEYCK